MGDILLIQPMLDRWHRLTVGPLRAVALATAVVTATCTFPTDKSDQVVVLIFAPRAW